MTLPPPLAAPLPAAQAALLSASGQGREAFGPASPLPDGAAAALRCVEGGGSGDNGVRCEIIVHSASETVLSPRRGAVRELSTVVRR